ncbi:MAG: type II toxin-antitoxin system VapC family toxin [Solirubrobacterales bacterium]|nr:type II toxin-antitoxin system VapC family toxin [Solirubrobacterales bacterium]
MRLLLDTQVILWLLDGDERVPEWLRTIAAERNHALHVSDVSIWEIAIKSSLDRLEVPADLPEHLGAAGLLELPIRRSHLWKIRELEFHHRDPFDRLLVAQALEENLTLVSRDRGLAAYGVALRW